MANGIGFEEGCISAEQARASSIRRCDSTRGNLAWLGESSPPGVGGRAVHALLCVLWLLRALLLEGGSVLQQSCLSSCEGLFVLGSLVAVVRKPVLERPIVNEGGALVVRKVCIPITLVASCC